MDFCQMYYIDKVNDDNDCDKNYCVHKNGSNNMYFIFNVYKTSKHFGRILVDVPEKLKNIICDYVKKYNVQNNTRLLRMSNETNLCTKIHNIMKKYLQKNIGVNMLRHIYITWMSYHYVFLNDADRKKIGILMGHSVLQQLKYSKHMNCNVDVNKEFFENEIRKILNVKIYNVNQNEQK